jgi:hypothetical protein
MNLKVRGQLVFIVMSTNAASIHQLEQILLAINLFTMETAHGHAVLIAVHKHPYQHIT